MDEIDFFVILWLKKSNFVKSIGGIFMALKETIQEFKEFAIKGNVVDMAVGVIIGGAFGKIVTSFVNDLIMPIIGKLTGGADFSQLYLPLDGNHYASLADAQAATATIAYGSFLTQVLDFLIVAIVIFAALKVLVKLLLLPVVVSISYEFNRFVGRHDNAVTRALSYPGMALQNFTTNEPDDSMIEVAIRALELVLPEREGDDRW